MVVLNNLKIKTMTVTKIEITNQNEKAINDYLRINHPSYKLVKEDEYEFHGKNGRYNSDREPLSKRLQTVRLELEGEDLVLELPLSTIARPTAAVIPVYLTQTDCIDLGSIIQVEKKPTFPREAEKVLSFHNFEVRDGKVVRRTNNRLVGTESIIIVKA